MSLLLILQPLLYMCAVYQDHLYFRNLAASGQQEQHGCTKAALDEARALLSRLIDRCAASGKKMIFFTYLRCLLSCLVCRDLSTCRIATVTVGGFQLCEYDITVMVGPSPGYLTLQGIVILHAENVSSAEMAAAISTLGDRLASL